MFTWLIIYCKASFIPPFNSTLLLPFPDNFALFSIMPSYSEIVARKATAADRQSAILSRAVARKERIAAATVKVGVPVPTKTQQRFVVRKATPPSAANTEVPASGYKPPKFFTRGRRSQIPTLGGKVFVPAKPAPKYLRPILLPSLFPAMRQPWFQHRDWCPCAGKPRYYVQPGQLCRAHEHVVLSHLLYNRSHSRKHVKSWIPANLPIERRDQWAPVKVLKLKTVRFTADTKAT